MSDLEVYMRNYILNTTWCSSHTSDRILEFMKIVNSSERLVISSRKDDWMLEVKNAHYKSEIPCVIDDGVFTVYHNITEAEARCIIINHDPFYCDALTCKGYIHEKYDPIEEITKTIDDKDITKTIDDKDIIECKIGILAHSIRGNWNYGVGARLDMIKELCEEIGRTDLIEEIEDSEDDIYYDGRWFRDCWSGPYNDNYSDDPEMYSKVRDIVEYVIEYDCCSLEEYDLCAKYRSGIILRYATLGYKVKNNMASKYEEKEFIEMSDRIHHCKYDRDEALEACKFMLSDDDLTEEDKKELEKYGSWFDY